MAANVGSRGVLEKVGLRLVETWHDPAHADRPDAGLGDVHYALTREEWIALAHA